MIHPHSWISTLRQAFQDDWNTERPLSARQSLLVGVAVAFIAGIAVWIFLSRPNANSDFFHYWSAARTLMSGGDPYTVIAEGPANPGRDPTLYPLPALLLLAPIASFTIPIAGALFFGGSSGLAAWAVSRTGVDRLPMFLSAPFLMAISLGQWSPLLVAATLSPWLGVFVAAKPNIGLASFIARPSWKTVGAVSLLLAISLVILPQWPLGWLANISNRGEKFVPLLRPGGFFLALSLLAWRRPEGRLLAVMCIVPQALFFYDQLLLWLIPRTLRQSLLMSLWSYGAFLIWWRVVARGDFNYVQQAVPYAYALYAPALAILLFNWYRDRLRATAV